MKKPSKEIQDDSFAERRLFYYNRTLRKVCQVEMFIPTTPDMLKFADESFVVADTASDAHKAEDAVPDAEPDDSDYRDMSGIPFTTKPKVPELSYAEKQAKEKAETREWEVSADKRALLERYEQDVAANVDGHSYQVHSTLAPLVLASATRLADKDRNRAIFNELKQKGSFRPLASIAADRFDAVFDALDQSHPLFKEVIAFIRSSLRLALRRGTPQCAPPMLLAGPPGLGKTHFAKAFATALGAEYHLMSFDTDHKSTALLGQDKNWGNNTPGIVYDAVIGGNCANPVLVLDELCKSRSGFGQYQHPLASLHSLLEPVSSKTVRDISIELELDASLITWICTANEIAAVPATIVSRLKVFHIQPATDAALAIQMARVMLAKTHELMALECFEVPSPSLAPLIAHLSPREQRQELEMAYAQAVAAGRTALRARDFDHLGEQAEQFAQKPLLH